MLRKSRTAGAFTLVEMLTVIAIITILAGLLVPVVQKAVARAKIAQTEGIISALQVPLQAYYADWGAYPPDTMIEDWNADGNIDRLDLRDPFTFVDGDVQNFYFTHPSTPAECLAFYLTTKFDPTETVGRVYIDDLVSGGYKLNTDDVNSDGKEDQYLVPGAKVVYGTKGAGSPYASIPAKRLKPFRFTQQYATSGHGVTGNDALFPSVTDGWQQPFLYNAPGGLYGEPLHNTYEYDLFSVGADSVTNRAATQTNSDSLGRPVRYRFMILMYYAPPDQVITAGHLPYGQTPYNPNPPPPATDIDWDAMLTGRARDNLYNPLLAEAIVPSCGNDVAVDSGGNTLTNDYKEADADDINNW